MFIKIAKKHILFSSRPKACYLVPKTSYLVTCYPTRLVFEDLGLEGKNIEFVWKHTGKISQFLTTLDLEKGFIEIAWRDDSGYYKIHVSCQDQKLLARLKKGSLHCITHKCDTEDIFILAKDIQEKKIDTLEKLSLGMHKALKYESLFLREDLKEILPLLYTQAQCVTDSHIDGNCAILKFLREVQKAPIDKKLDKLLDVYKAGFSALIPKLTDDFYQGYYKQDDVQGLSSLVLLNRLKDLIRGMFFEQKENVLSVLQQMLFPFGRMKNIHCKDLGFLDIEWSKKQIKKAIFYSKNKGTIRLSLHPSIKSFRIRKSRSDIGQAYVPMQEIFINPDEMILFDRFQK